MLMCVRRIIPEALLLVALLAPLRAGRAQAQLIEGVSGWADAVVGLSTTKWTGARVPYPTPQPRPATEVRLSSQSLPLSVHGQAADGPRLLEVLAAAEATHELLSAAGLQAGFGDAGQGGSGGRDLYVVAHPTSGAAAYPDASGNFAALDGARAYGVIDDRVPSERVFVCTAQALLEAQLLELDPAEAPSVRESVAAYFARLVTGEPGCDDGTQPDDLRRDNPFAHPSSGAAWWHQLAGREDRNRGVFMHEMWQFARQRTWEGHDLRASPDLFEAIAKALDLKRVEFAHVASEIAMERALTGFAPVRSLAFESLPAFLPKTELTPAASLSVVVRLKEPRPGVRVRVWAEGAPGARYALAASGLDGEDQLLALVEAPVRKEPTSQLSVELNDATRAVLITVINLGADPPDLDAPIASHDVALTIDHVP